MEDRALLEDEDENACCNIREFYYRNLPFLMKVPLSNIPAHVLRCITVGIHSHLLFDSEWRDYVFSFGIEDNYILNSIEVSAKVSNDSPIYVALSGPLNHQMSYGSIIETLLTKERIDILTRIKPFTIQKYCTTQVKRLASAEEQKFSTTKGSESTTETPLDLKSSNINADISDKHIPIVWDISKSKRPKCEINSLQSSASVSIHTAMVQMQPTSKTKEHNIDVMNVHPSAPSEDRLSVFIQHTEYESSIAEQLSAMLKDEGIIVQLSSGMDHVIMMDFDGAFATILQGVDFIVPIVSDKFLEQIHPRVNMQYLESLDAMNNRSLYQLCMNEYRTNRCVNFRVRPVLVPGFNRNVLKYDIILSSSLRLWNEVPKLVKILKKTKEMIPNHLLH